MPKKIVLIGHNIRSAQNVGSLLRIANGTGVETFYPTGYTPYPLVSKDTRLPHESRRVTQRIAKTALGSDKGLFIKAGLEIFELIANLQKNAFQVIALEQAASSISLKNFKPPAKIALIVGNEVNGLEKAILKASNQIVEIPMLGDKESFNVASAAAIALYQIAWYNG